MQDADLFLELAAIAGAFVGFGALIAVRSGGASDAFEVAYIRGVVSFSLLTVVAALAPVTISRYTLSEHDVWALSSALALVVLAATVVANVLTPEYRADVNMRVRPTFPRWVLVPLVAAVGILFVGMVLAPTVILLRAATDIEAALYFTFVVLILVFAAWLLIQMVFRGQRSATA